MRAIPARLATSALSLCMLAACRANSAAPLAAPESDCALRRQLEAATLDADPLVRRAAVRVLGNRGPGSSVDVVGELVSDPDESVAVVAVEALAEMNLRGGDYRARAAEHLARAVRGGSPRVRYFALNALGSCHEAAAGQLDTIRACFEDEPPDTQIAAASAWSKIGGAADLEARVVQLVEANSGGFLDHSLAQLLPALEDPSHASVLEKLLVSPEPSARFQAECARARLAGGREPWGGAERVEAQWTAENRAAEVGLLGAAWKPVPRSEVVARAANARLVLCGEMHESEGPIRANQRDVLRAFVKRPAFEAVGYEPSVEEAQKSVLDLARSLGLQTIALEANGPELTAQGRDGARELEALDAIGAFLGKNPSNRMLVLRGESHVLPGGFLARRLAVKPLVILSGCNVNVPLCMAGLHCNGFACEVGTTGDVYTLPYDEPWAARETAALEGWLAVH